MKIGLEVPENGGEYVLTASAVIAEDTIWAEKGHEISFAQEVVKTPEVEAEKITAKAEIVYGDFCIGVHGENFSMQFDKREGGVSSLIYDGTEYITRTPKMHSGRLQENVQSFSVLKQRKTLTALKLHSDSLHLQ